MKTFTLQVNGQPRTVDVAEDTPLLWVLRDHLDLVDGKAELVQMAQPRPDRVPVARR